MGMEPNALYTIGLDYGSLSCRGVLVDVRDGAICAEAAMAYPHAVITQCLPDGTPLKGDWCLQHPQDFTAALETVVPALMKESGIAPEQVVGIGIDCTASTVMPLDADFRPLCLSEKFTSRPHAWLKMWKHHGAADQAAADQSASDQGTQSQENKRRSHFKKNGEQMTVTIPDSLSEMEIREGYVLAVTLDDSGAAAGVELTSKGRHGSADAAGTDGGAQNGTAKGSAVKDGAAAEGAGKGRTKKGKSSENSGAEEGSKDSEQQVNTEGPAQL